MDSPLKKRKYEAEEYSDEDLYVNDGKKALKREANEEYGAADDNVLMQLMKEDDMVPLLVSFSPKQLKTLKRKLTSMQALIDEQILSVACQKCLEYSHKGTQAPQSLYDDLYEAALQSIKSTEETDTDPKADTAMWTIMGSFRLRPGGSKVSVHVSAMQTDDTYLQECHLTYEGRLVWHLSKEMAMDVHATVDDNCLWDAEAAQEMHEGSGLSEFDTRDISYVLRDVTAQILHVLREKYGHENPANGLDFPVDVADIEKILGL